LAAGGLVAFTQVDAEFSFTDFFPSDSDAILSFNKLETHLGESSGGSGFIYIEGDLTDPEALIAIEKAITTVDESDAELSRDLDRELVVSQTAASVARVAVASDASRSAIERSSGITIGSVVEDLTGEQLEAIYEHARTEGLVDEAGELVFPPNVVQATVDDLGDGDYATSIGFGVTTLTEDEIIVDFRSTLDSAAEQLERGPAAGSLAVVSVSGETIVSQDSLDQFTKAMLLSLPVALLLCALLAMAFMRSFKYGAIAVLPVLLVVGWVYGFMYLFDYKINVVTATIAAIAVGVGIDFSTHFTMRFREEFETEPSRFPAMRRAGAGTGGALLLSAVSSVVGFLIMSFAPMPIFKTFGILTAVMIFFSAVVALFVLPSLLLVVTPSRKGREREQLEEAATGGHWGYQPHERATADRTGHQP
jgi:predicted RND superfamily exporter protein